MKTAAAATRENRIVALTSCQSQKDLKRKAGSSVLFTMFCATTIAVVIDSFAKLVVYICFLLVGCLVWLAGQWFFGWQREGGKRLAVFVFGVLAQALGVGLAYHAWPDFISMNFPMALLMLVGVAFCLLGTVMVIISIASSNERIREWMKAILRGSDIHGF